MSEEENKQPQIIMGGVSGNKELRVRRVHKKKADEIILKAIEKPMISRHH